MNTENPKFADSAKNEETHYYDHPALDVATKTLFNILNEKRAKEGPVKPGLAALLRDVQTQQTFAGERDENGRQIFKSFEQWLKTTRRLYVEEGDGSRGDNYKRVTEALTYNRLQDAKLNPLPDKRSVLQKVSSVELELQTATWQRTLNDNAGNNFGPKHVAKAALALGSKKATIPTPTASSKMPEIREEWAAVKIDLVNEFGHSVERHFQSLDELLGKRIKATVADDEGGVTNAVSKDSKAETSTASPQSAQPEVKHSAAIINEASPEASSQNANGKDDTNVRAEESAAPNTVNSITTPPSETPDTNSTNTHERDNFILVRANNGFGPLLTASRPWVTAFEDSVFVGFESKAHLQIWMAAGMSHPGPNYDFKKSMFKGVWEHREKLGATEQMKEVRRIADQLAATHKKGAPMKGFSGGKAA